MQVINDTDLHHFGKEMNKHMNSHKSSFCKKKKKCFLDHTRNTQVVQCLEYLPHSRY